jgi:glycosyltransferase involved in cell wall biosynthesis
MRAAIVHYHLRRGGVSTVIRHAVTSLQERGHQAVVLVGEAPDEAAADTLPYAVIDELGYADGSTRSETSEQLLEKIRRAVRRELGGDPDLWHFHNHSLGKNLAVPKLVHQLATAGEPLLLQIHDFPEDGRPDNYRFLLQNLAGGERQALGPSLYPQAPNVHYAVLNSRDLEFMRNAGVAKHNIHFLPNAVAMADRHPGRENKEPRKQDEGRLFLYPTRAIRRKNLGEFLLWSACAPAADDRFAVTLAPRNPAQRPVYEQWVQFASTQHLPVEFEVGRQRGQSLECLFQQAAAAVTTSIAEGFGLAFLEPWLAGCPLLGRRLPEVTGQFEQSGIDLSFMYDAVRVPMEWIGAEQVRRRLTHGLRQLLETYGRPMTAATEQALEDLCGGETVDFAVLDEAMQQEVILAVLASAENARLLAPRFLGEPEQSAAAMDGNAKIIRDQYSVTRYGENLSALYGMVLRPEAGAASEFNADILLNSFLAPRRFSLLRV